MSYGMPDEEVPASHEKLAATMTSNLPVDPTGQTHYGMPDVEVPPTFAKLVEKLEQKRVAKEASTPNAEPTTAAQPLPEPTGPRPSSPRAILASMVTQATPEEAFDPDKYLAEKGVASEAFDPDAYMRDKGIQVEPPGMLESAARGAAQGATLGAAPALAGLGEAIGDALPVALGGAGPGSQAAKESFLDRYRRHRDEYRAGNTAASNASPYIYGGSELVGGALPLLAGGLFGKGAQAATKAPGMLSQLAEGNLLGKAVAAGARAAPLGAAMGLLGSPADLTQGDVGGAAKDALVGGATGAALGALGPPASAYARAGLKRLGPGLVEKGIERGRRMLGGDVTGTLSNKKPLSDEAVREAIESGAIRPLGTFKGTLNRLRGLRRDVGGQYGELVDAMGAKGIEGPADQPLEDALRQRAADMRSSGEGFLSPAPASYENAADELASQAAPARAARAAHQAAVHGAEEAASLEALENAGAEVPMKGQGAVVESRPGVNRIELPGVGEIHAQSQPSIRQQVQLAQQLGIPPDKLHTVLWTNVKPELRGQGYGKELYARMLKQIGDGTLASDVLDSTTPEAARVWESLKPHVENWQSGTGNFGGVEKPWWAASGLRDAAEGGPARDALEALYAQPAPSENLPLGVAENMRRGAQEAAQAEYERVGGHKAVGKAQMDIASRLKQSIEDAVEAQAHKAPEEAAAFRPVKQRLSRVLDATKAAEKGMARVLRRGEGPSLKEVIKRAAPHGATALMGAHVGGLPGALLGAGTAGVHALVDAVGPSTKTAAYYGLGRALENMGTESGALMPFLTREEMLRRALRDESSNTTQETP